MRCRLDRISPMVVTRILTSAERMADLSFVEAGESIASDAMISGPPPRVNFFLLVHAVACIGDFFDGFDDLHSALIGK
jgi:hypothetical protein